MSPLSLHARIGELEALLEARAEVIVCLHRRIAEIEGEEQSDLVQRLQRAEDNLRAIESTWAVRLLVASKRFAARLRRVSDG